MSVKDIRAAVTRGVLPEIKPLQPLAAELEKEQKEEVPWIDCLSSACCTSEQLQKLEIEPRKPFLGDWLREGDLGFIFAGRGIGKTWLAIDLARGLAGGLNVGPWESHGVFPALYLDGEMPPEDVKQRDISLGQGTGNLTYINHDILFQRTGRVMNLADPLLQEAILHLCIETGKKVLFLDNLSTLVAGAQENDGKDWEILQPWLLRLRRQKITVVFIHHAGRNNMMRGHSKREDTCFWIIRLDKKASVNDELGAVFLSTFTKWRNSKREPSTYEWHYQPAGDKTEVTYKQADKLDVLRQQIEDGMDSGTEIAEEMGVSKGYVSKLAAKAERQGWLRKIKGGKYQIVEDWER